MAGIVLASLVSLVAGQGASKEFPAGWNGRALTPPMGWRSWNAFGNRISQEMMNDAMDALTAKEWDVGVGVEDKVSLADVGYASVGVDEGWEGCHEGVNGTQHDADGYPVVNKKFPDLKSLVDRGHKAGLKVGWYLNGCACGEKKEVRKNYEGDIMRLHEYGFDSVKIDGCGAQVNQTFYAELMRATGRNYTIENCHWGKCGPFRGDPDGSSCPTEDWCPFNFYRTSGDINSGNMSWFRNLQSAERFLGNPPLSRPGCWAYPDMLEVGRVQGSPEWNRAHFGAWCIVSAPLILGLDLSKKDILSSTIPYITNKEAIAVNQNWAGHPGRFVETSGDIQVLAKPQPDAALAVLIINKGSSSQTVSLDFSQLSFGSKAASVRNIWQRRDEGQSSEKFVVTVPATDSGFYLLRPASGSVYV